MEIDLIIDVLTPCLIERNTDRVVKTTYRIIEKDEIPSITKGWSFDWLDSQLDDYVIYGVALEDGTIQGLLAVKPDKGFIEAGLVENAPSNVGRKGLYNGVGSHLFAIAAKISFQMGFEGYISFVSKTGLVEHYKKRLNARQISGQRMYLNTEASYRLVQTYFGKEEKL